MPMPAPVVKARANWRCHAQISIELQLFGEPKTLISRSTQGCASESAVPELVVTPKATASGPLSAAMRRSAVAVSSIERLVPGDLLPAGVWVALWPGAAHGMEQPVGRFDQRRRGAPLGAQRLAGRVRWVRLDRHKASVLDNRLAAAARGAEWAECWNAATGALGHRHLNPDWSNAFSCIPRISGCYAQNHSAELLGQG